MTVSYSRFTLPGGVTATRQHILAHISSVASVKGDPEEFVDHIEISATPARDELGREGFTLTGTLPGHEPRADYLEGNTEGEQ